MEHENYEILRLMFELRDEGATSERVAQLEAILKERPDLWEYYGDAVRLADMIPEEMGAAVAVAPYLPDHEAPDHEAPDFEAVSTRNVHAATMQIADRSLFRRFASWRLALAASLAVLALGGAVRWSWLNNEPHNPAPTFQPALVHDNYIRRTPDGLEVTEPKSLRTVSEALRSKPLRRILLPRLSADLYAQAALLSPAEQNQVWLEGDDWRGRGYLFALPPAGRMDIVGQTGISKLNTIVMLGVNPSVSQPINLVSYTRLAPAGLRVKHAQAGCIGRSVIENTSSKTEYLLLVGSHASQESIAPGSWKLSDYKVELEADGLLVMGWQDAPYEQTSSREHPRMVHFSDMLAVAHFVNPTDPARPPEGSVRYEPTPLADGQISLPHEGDLLLNVDPHEQIVLMASNSRHSPSSLDVIEGKSNRVIWKQSRAPHGKTHSSRTPAIYAIYNDTSQAQTFRLQSRKGKAGSSEATHCVNAPFAVHSSAVGCEAIGFEDTTDAAQLFDKEDTWVLVFRFQR